MFQVIKKSGMTLTEFETAWIKLLSGRKEKGRGMNEIQIECRNLEIYEYRHESACFLQWFLAPS
jgi:hypothetical protein